MTNGQWIGLLLVLMALVDLVLAFVVVGPRLPEKSRRTVQWALVIGSLVIGTLGVLFWSSALGAGGARGA